MRYRAAEKREIIDPEDLLARAGKVLSEAAA